MIIHIKSNFVIPGLEERENIEFNRSEIRLREFLEEISRMAPVRIEFIRNGMIDSEEWEIEINDKPYYTFDGGLDTILKDNDTVTIKVMAIGGG